jgi:septal ring factor EnvC (AmiA/AmiB activator)
LDEEIALKRATLDEQTRLVNELAKKHKNLNQLIASSTAAQEESTAKQRRLDKDLRAMEADLVEKRGVAEAIVQDIRKAEQRREVHGAFDPFLCSLHGQLSITEVIVRSSPSGGGSQCGAPDP